jgi:predicted methyltransferase
VTQSGRAESHDGGTYGSAIAAEGWQRGSMGRADLRPITERMLDLAGIGSGHRVLDVAAGTGEQTLMAARRVGPHGFVLGVTAESVEGRSIVLRSLLILSEALWHIRQWQMHACSGGVSN